MKTDLSKVLYDKYFKLKNRIIEIELKNNSLLKGKFISFVKGNSTYISKWHVVDANVFFGMDAFGFLEGKIINHKDITKIKFLEDNSEIIFS